MPRRFALISTALALVLVAGACSGDDAVPADPTTEAPPTTDATTTVPPTSTTAPATTVTTAATTTTSEPPEIVVNLDGADAAPAGFAEAVAGFYAWAADTSGPPPPGVPEGLVDHLSGITVTDDQLVRGEWATAELPDGSAIGVADLGSDVVLAVSDGAGWRVVGAKLARFDAPAWYGDPIRRVLVIGTDARPGQDQQGFRADSIHILTSAISEQTGAVVGFPRDAHVPTPTGGRDKYTHINVYHGTDAMIQVAEELSGLEVEGYLITGFLGFEQLVNAFDGVPVTVPFGMAEPLSGAYLSSGYQTLWGANALAFSRNRTIPNGDFRRSLHQGLVVLGALAKVQEIGVLALPDLLAMLGQFTWTDLDAEALLTMAAGAYEIDAATVPNVTLPGSIRTVGGASVVVLADGAFDILADLDDGKITGELPTGTLTSGP